MRNRWLPSSLAVASLAALGAWHLSDRADGMRETARAPASVPVAVPAARVLPTEASEPGPPPSPDAPALTAATRIIVGGGSFPQSTEVSLEQDVLLAKRVMGPQLRVLFAGGARAAAVRELAATRPVARAPLLSRLGDVFAPRPGRGSRYRRPALPRAGRATEDGVRSLLGDALSLRGEPLWLHVATHGEQGPTARDNHVGLWAGGLLHVDALARLHDRAPRPLRVVIASCYSGGFAELAFVGADEQLGASPAPRCGLFAGTWDRQTSGCDPNPDRRRQEGYSLHFLHALRGEDRAGQALAAGALDLDADGRLSLLEAHTRARIASMSIDVPTTTSERLLRSVQRTGGEADTQLLPEERAVLKALGELLGIEAVASARDRLGVLERRLADLDAAVIAAEEASHQAYLRLAAALLERWPVLDDPYHPEFAATFARDAEVIARVLDRSAEARAFDAAQRVLEASDDRYWDLRVDEALLSRYLRSHETLGLATALGARGGDDWDAYQRLLTCERWVPALRGAVEGGLDGLE